MKQLGACLFIAFVLLAIPSCKREITPEERLMSELRQILEEAYGKDYVLQKFGTGQ